MTLKPLVPDLAVRILEDLHALTLAAQAEGCHEAASSLIVTQIELLMTLARWTPKPSKRRSTKRRKAR